MLAAPPLGPQSTVGCYPSMAAFPSGAAGARSVSPLPAMPSAIWGSLGMGPLRPSMELPMANACSAASLPYMPAVPASISCGSTAAPAGPTPTFSATAPPGRLRSREAPPTPVLPFSSSTALASASSLPGRAPSRTASPGSRYISPSPQAVSPVPASREGGCLRPVSIAQSSPTENGKASPSTIAYFLNGRVDDTPANRRPTDPFFYPTTVNPLTSYGAEQTPASAAFPQEQLSLLAASRSVQPMHRLAEKREEAPLFVDPPLQSFLDQPEEMRLLQEQNDTLAKQVQALEHAKSLAAVQSAQALQKIRGRQEQLRKEAQQAMRNSKEMQAEFGRLSDHILDATPGRAMPSAEPLSATPSQAAGASPGIPERPLWNSEVWQDLPSQESAPSGQLSLVHERSSPMQAGYHPSSSSGAAALPPNDIPEMANQILSTHQASTLANGTLYVDAMGNPLGPFQGREFPNIKDDSPCALPELRSHDRQADYGSSMMMQSTSSQLYSNAEASHALEDAEFGRAFDEPNGNGSLRELPAPQPSSSSSAVVHERVRTPSSAAHLGSPGLAIEDGYEATDNGPACIGPAGFGSEHGAIEDSPNRDLQRMPPSGAADAAAGGALPSRSESSGRRRPDDTRASRQVDNNVRRDAPPVTDATSSMDTGAGGLRNMPPDTSEELQAELDECLDMISWCGQSLTRESLQSLQVSKPPAVVKDVLETVTLLLGVPETRWDKLKRFIASPTFLDKIQKLNFQQTVSRDMFRKLRARLQQPEFDEEQIKQVCVPVVPLAMWCRAIGVFLSKTRYRGGPDIRPVAGAGAAAPPPYIGTLSAPAQSSYIVFDPDVRSMSPDELRAVENLTISRPDVGRICFQGFTDCSGLDFERIVRLEIGEVLVYPDSGQKPPVGVGLNKAATVTMFQCWPPNGSKLLQDQRSQDRYKKKIKQMTEQKQARFLDYDCNTGIWEFSVEHF